MERKRGNEIPCKPLKIAPALILNYKAKENHWDEQPAWRLWTILLLGSFLLHVSLLEFASLQVQHPHCRNHKAAHLILQNIWRAWHLILHASFWENWLAYLELLISVWVFGIGVPVAFLWVLTTPNWLYTFELTAYRIAIWYHKKSGCYTKSHMDIGKKNGERSSWSSK